MSTRRLPEIDLAKLAMIDDDDLLARSLQAHSAGGGSWSYSPARDLTPDILNARLPLVGRIGSPSWRVLEREIVRKCNRGDEQEYSNLEVSEILYKRCQQSGWLSAKVDMGSLPIGFGDSIRYWSDVVIENENGLFIPFFDHRRKNGLRATNACRFVFSVQNLWVRERNLDLREARLAIVSFPPSKDTRKIHIRFAESPDLMPYEEVNTRVRRVYEIWAQVLEQRTTRKRSTGTSGPTPLGFV